MKANQADFAVRTMAQVLKVSTSGFYDWLDRPACAREQANQTLLVAIHEIYKMSDSTYGAPRIKAQLDHLGNKAGFNRVARLMKGAKLRGVSRRRGFVVTTNADHFAKPAVDLVKRQFTATAPNQLWVADMTYIPTWEGFTYLATVLDVFSRKIVGWAFSHSMTADIVLAALNMALLTRKPGSVIHHSDHGSQYTSIAFTDRCIQMKVTPSMGTVGDAYDNAMAESFFATLECELINRRAWKTKRQAETEIFVWIESWYNPRRLHSSIGYQSPNNFERLYAIEQVTINVRKLAEQAVLSQNN
jgi:putative transposase